MPDFAQIKRRIEGIEAVRDSARVIERVSAADIDRFRRIAARLGDYISTLEVMVRELTTEVELAHPLFLEKPSPGPTAVVVITSDRGLSGAYNRGVLDLAASLPLENSRYIVVGRKGKEAFDHAKREYVLHLPGLSDEPTETDMEPLEKYLISGFSENRFGAVVIVYSHFASIAVSDPTVEVFLPFSERPLLRGIAKVGKLPIIEPNVASIVDYLIREYVSLELFRIAIDSKLSELSSRTVAAGAAADRADEMARNLRRRFLKLKRAQITKSIGELFASRYAEEGG